MNGDHSWSGPFDTPGGGKVWFAPKGTFKPIGNVPPLTIAKSPDPTQEPVDTKPRNAPKGPRPRGTYVTPEINRRTKK